jgi:hypothetical protein
MQKQVEEKSQAYHTINRRSNGNNVGSTGTSLQTSKMASNIPHFCIGVCISAAAYAATSIASGRSIGIKASIISIGICISGSNTNSSGSSNNKSRSRHVDMQAGRQA